MSPTAWFYRSRCFKKLPTTTDTAPPMHYTTRCLFMPIFMALALRMWLLFEAVLGMMCWPLFTWLRPIFLRPKAARFGW